MHSSVSLFNIMSDVHKPCVLLEVAIRLEQWFPNCDTRTTSGTRRPSKWYARPFCSSTPEVTNMRTAKEFPAAREAFRRDQQS